MANSSTISATELVVIIGYDRNFAVLISINDLHHRRHTIVSGNLQRAYHADLSTVCLSINGWDQMIQAMAFAENINMYLQMPA